MLIHQLPGKPWPNMPPKWRCSTDKCGRRANLMKKMDLEKDTILIFLSEQGIAMPRGKWSPYEHGSRALCLAHWEGANPAQGDIRSRHVLRYRSNLD